jgi:hypothetical protein
MRGVLEDDEAAAYLDFIRAHTPGGNGVLYVVYDLTHLKRIAEGARKRTTKVERPYPFGGLAIVGANFSTRTLVDMILRAARLFKPEFVAFPHEFFVSVDAANSWFDELRNKGG